MSDSLRKNKQSTKASKTPLLMGIGLAAAVLALVAAVFFVLKQTDVVEPVALRVGDSEVTKRQFEEYVALGKKTVSSKADVKKVIVEYEKNKAMAEKYDLDIPEAYVALSRTDMVSDAAFGESGGSIDTLRTADDEFTQMRLYNSAFATFVEQAAQGGWGIVLYDIPLSNVPDAELIATTKKQANDIRTQLVDEAIDTETAVEKARALNFGQPAQTGMYFIRESDGAVISRYGGGFYTRLLEPSFITAYLKDKKVGVTEVTQYEKLSMFFADVMYVQEKREGLTQKIETDKTKIEVVDYVKE